MGPPLRAKYSRISVEEVQAVSSAIGEQENSDLKGEVNSDTTVEQLFQYLYPGDTQHAYLISLALVRFTPATLCYMNHEGVGKFLQEMASELSFLGLKYSAEADLSAAYALPSGEKI